MESLNPTAENVEINLQTPTISDLLPETITPVKQVGKPGRAKPPNPAPAPKRDSDDNEVLSVQAEVLSVQTLADYIVQKVAGHDLNYKADFEESKFITALKLHPLGNQQIKGMNAQLRGFALKLAREWETVSPNPNPTQSSMIIKPCTYLDGNCLLCDLDGNCLLGDLDYMGYKGTRGNPKGCLLCDLDYMGYKGTRGSPKGCLLCDLFYMGYKGTRGSPKGCLLCDLFYMGYKGTRGNPKGCLLYALDCKGQPQGDPISYPTSRGALSKFPTRPQIYTLLGHMHTIHVPPWPPDVIRSAARCHECRICDKISQGGPREWT